MPTKKAPAKQAPAKKPRAKVKAHHSPSEKARLVGPTTGKKPGRPRKGEGMPWREPHVAGALQTLKALYDQRKITEPASLVGAGRCWPCAVGRRCAGSDSVRAGPATAHHHMAPTLTRPLRARLPGPLPQEAASMLSELTGIIIGHTTISRKFQ